MRGRPETSVTNNQSFVASQMSEDLIYTAAETWHHAFAVIIVDSLYMLVTIRTQTRLRDN